MTRRKGSAREATRSSEADVIVASVRRSLVDAEKRGLIRVEPRALAAIETAIQVVRYLWADGFNVVRRARQ